MDRVILHCDLNSFYASVEELYHPQDRGKPIAVGGDVDSRHGIILSKNPAAGKAGVKTGEALWQARIKCPDLIIYKPQYKRYMLFSNRIREIFREYTDLVEPFGLDEAWLDVTASSIYGTGQQIADELRRRIFFQLGITASVGVSFNKIFAKLGSDLRKPDYTTVISRENFRQTVWPLSCDQMLYVGKSTAARLAQNNINTIGQLAGSSPLLLKRVLGKWGEVLQGFAQGRDVSPVARFNDQPAVKSIGNSVTTYRDLVSRQDVDLVLWVLAESVASRLRDHGLKASLVSVSFRDNSLFCFSRQMPVEPTNISGELMQAARKLYVNNYDFSVGLRSIGIRAAHLTAEDSFSQLSLFEDEECRQKKRKLEDTIDDIRSRYGFDSIKRMSMLLDPELTGFDPKGDHVIHPEAFRK